MMRCSWRLAEHRSAEGATVRGPVYRSGRHLTKPCGRQRESDRAKSTITRNMAELLSMRPVPFSEKGVAGASVVCTVATGKYLPQAFIAIESALAHSVVATVGVILIGDDSEVASVETPVNIQVLRLADVMSADVEREMRLVYSPLEFGTALKPFLVGTVLDAVGGGRVLLVDADTMSVASIDAAFDALNTSSILIFPHYITPTFDFAGALRDKLLLPAGVFNTGLMAFRDDPHAHALADWWRVRTRFWNRHFVDAHEFLDQRWFDFVPSLFAGVACRGVPGLNVGHWNLFECGTSSEITMPTHLGAVPALLHFSGISLATDTPLLLWQIDATAALAHWWTEQAVQYRTRVLARRAVFPPHADVPAQFADGTLVSPQFTRYAFGRREALRVLPTDETALRRGEARRGLGNALRRCRDQVKSLCRAVVAVPSAAAAFLRTRTLR